MCSWLAGIGLILGFAGAMLMFRFGVPAYPERSRAGSSFLLLETTDEDEKRRVVRAARFGTSGVALVAAGFVFQFFALVWGTEGHGVEGRIPQTRMNTEADDGTRTHDTWLGRQGQGFPCVPVCLLNGLTEQLRRLRERSCFPAFAHLTVAETVPGSAQAARVKLATSSEPAAPDGPGGLGACRMAGHRLDKCVRIECVEA